jgi:hypothetical protein
LWKLASAQLVKASPEAAADDLIDKAIINTPAEAAAVQEVLVKMQAIIDMNIGHKMAGQVLLQIF